MSANPPELASFGEDLTCCVVGASGGIGRGFVQHLAASPRVGRVLALSRNPPAAAAAKTTWIGIDLEDEGRIAAAVEEAGRAAEAFDIVVAATGLLHDGNGLQPEKTWRQLEAASMERAFRINSIGPALLAKHFVPRLARDRKAVFAALSARVGSIDDNELGGWHAYRASKAALNMLIRNFAIELARRNPTAYCVGLHPGTVDTGLSKPFQGGVPEGKLFSPAQSAAYLLGVLDSLAPGDSGRLFAWDGQRIPF